MADIPRSLRQFVTLLDADGNIYTAGEGIASSVTITGSALTALEASAASLASIEADTAAIATAIGVAGDAAGDPTVIGLLKQIAENTTP